MTRLTGPTAHAPAGSLQDTLARFVTAYLMDFGAAAERHGLTPTQAKVVLLMENGEAMPMRAIADRLFCDPSNITGIVDRMESHGLVRREVNPSDRRVKNVLATPEGLALARQIRTEQKRTHEALDLLTPEESDALAAALTRMLPALES
jgi:DNA-binding MarR family transcriptional regulator